VQVSWNRGGGTWTVGFAVDDSAAVVDDSAAAAADVAVAVVAVAVVAVAVVAVAVVVGVAGVVVGDAALVKTVAMSCCHISRIRQGCLALDHRLSIETLTMETIATTTLLSKECPRIIWMSPMSMVRDRSQRNRCFEAL